MKVSKLIELLKVENQDGFKRANELTDAGQAGP